jgi:hypothetical protein
MLSILLILLSLLCLVTVFAILVAAMTGIYRIGFCYHFFGDVCIGAILGIFIGYKSYKIINVLDTNV